MAYNFGEGDRIEFSISVFVYLGDCITFIKVILKIASDASDIKH